MKVGDLVTKIVSSSFSHVGEELYGLVIETGDRGYRRSRGAEPDYPVTSVKVAWTDYGTFWQSVNAKIEVINESR